MENKTCRQCQTNFTVTDDDLKFLDKISPKFGGKKYLIPSPNDCPECRRRQRLAWRNVRNVYQRVVSGREYPVISVYPSNCRYQIMHEDDTRRNDYDLFKYGREFDFNRSFFEQLQELHLVVPKPHTISDGTNENSEFINGANHVKNAYLCFNAMYSNDIYFCDAIYHSSRCMDCLTVTNCENCYELVDCINLYACYFCQDCNDGRELLFCRNLIGCHDCFGCINLRNKEYFWFNEPKTKEEYEKLRREFKIAPENIITARKELAWLYCSQPVKFAKQSATENSTGENLTNCKNCQECFDINEGENLKYCMNLNGGNKDCQDVTNFGSNLELSYQAVSTGRNAYHMLFTSMCAYESSDIYYSLNCKTGNKNLFGCVELHHSQYCILNKQYSKEEYEKLVPQIIERMQKTGEWGDFFPIKDSPWCYNESSAMEYYPLKREEAISLGAIWQDEDFGLKYEGPFYTPKEISVYDPKKNPAAQAEIDELLKGIIKCEITGKPFRIISQELAFYIEHGLPIPTKHPNQRYQERFAQRRPRKLYDRQCMCAEPNHNHQTRCPNQFATTYSPDRPEKVYCEECYQKSVL